MFGHFVLLEGHLEGGKCDELNYESMRIVVGPYSNIGTDSHLLLAKFIIPNVDLCALEDFSDVIQLLQAKKLKNTMVASKSSVVPLKPSRSVGLLVTDF